MSNVHFKNKKLNLCNAIESIYSEANDVFEYF